MEGGGVLAKNQRKDEEKQENSRDDFPEKDGFSFEKRQVSLIEKFVVGSAEITIEGRHGFVAIGGDRGEGFLEGGIEPQRDHWVMLGRADVFEVGEFAEGLSFWPSLAKRVFALCEQVIGNGCDREEIGLGARAGSVAVFGSGEVDGAKGGMALEGAAHF